MYELAEREDDQDETDLSDQPIIHNNLQNNNEEQNQNHSLDDNKPQQIQITSSCASSSSSSSNHSNHHNNSHKANHTPSNSFQLRRMACFGSPKYDRQSALHILSADSRFPDIAPGQQLASGNHFLALIPESIMRSIAREGEGDGGGGTRKRKRNIQKGASIRGGGANANDNNDDDDDENNAAMSTSNGVNIVRKRRKRRRGRGTDGKHPKGELIEGAVNVNPSGEGEEEGSFFSHGIFKLIRSSSERRTRSGFDSNSKSTNGPVRSSIVEEEEEKGLWRWIANLWIDCIMQFLNGI